MNDISIILNGAVAGGRAVVGLAAQALAPALAAHGEARPVSFPDTAYSLPVIYALTGRKIGTLGQLDAALKTCRAMLPPEGGAAPTLEQALAAGRATLMAAEAIEAIRHLDGPPHTGIWLGPTGDSILRSQGVKLVDGSMPGIAAVVGAPSSRDDAVRLARSFQERNILVVMAGTTGDTSMAEQLHEAGVELSWDTFLVPYGRELTTAIYALGFAARAAMTFGGVLPREDDGGEGILAYNRARVHAFVVALGPLDEVRIAVAAGALNFGFPVLSDQAIPEILAFGPEKRDLVVGSVPLDRMAERAIEVRGLKIRVSTIDIPVLYGPAFEGERVRKGNIGAEFGGKHAPAFEFLKSAASSEVEDGRIELVGPDIGEVPEGTILPLAIVVRVAGRKMQRDFESILERHIHSFLSEAMGVMHIGQRDVLWLRVSKDAAKAGFRMRHLGVILRSKMLNDFPAIVDKVEVALYTKRAKVEELLPEAKAAYAERDQRMGEMTDESVDTFYSCQLCQSYAPNHVCIITPERLGLCGAYNWLDGKAAHQINPTGANQPVKKGETLDGVKGKWQGINDFVFERSNKTIASFSAYSAMDDPMTSCGCFECIVAILPDANGFMIVNREHTGMTPSGMNFSALAEAVGGGQQTPGFIGIGTRYILSKKFLSADGGLKRIVWMTREIKERLADELAARCEEIGEKDLLEKIADETVATDGDALLEHLKKVAHPALEMEPLL